MANCPNCNNSLPFFKVGFLSRMKNKIRCKSCSRILTADKSQMGVLGGLGGGLGGALIIWNKEIFGNHPSSILIALALGVALVFIVAIIQNNSIKLSVAEDQNDETFKENEIKIDTRPPLPKNATRIEYLKNRYYNKSNSELQSIASANDHEMTKEAQEVAKELLNERNTLANNT